MPQGSTPGWSQGGVSFKMKCVEHVAMEGMECVDRENVAPVLGEVLNGGESCIQWDTGHSEPEDSGDEEQTLKIELPNSRNSLVITEFIVEAMAW